jgi:hypothetical protein
MPFISREQAEAKIQPYFGDLEKIVRLAWSDWLKCDLAPQMQHKRVRANYIWNQLIAHAKRQFHDQSEVHVENYANLDGILFDGNIFVRMKKASNKLYSSNYPTQAALAFHDQIQDIFGGVARLELVYVLNQSETNIERITLIQRHNKNIGWMIDLLTSSTETQNIIPLEQNEVSNTEGTVAERLIKPLAGDKENDKRGTGTE